jgi:hypothetical protein
MADAISTGNPVPLLFIVNKYDDIDGSRVAQATGRGFFCFRGTNGKMNLPSTQAEANKAVTPVDWAKPLNPGPYFNNGVGLNGSTVYPFGDGDLTSQENDFTLDPNQAFNSTWPTGITVFEIPPMFYNKAVPSGAMCLVYDGEATVTYGSGHYTGYVTDYTVGALVYADYGTNAGKMTYSSHNASGVAVGVVMSRGTFGDQTITVKVRGTSALS